MNNLLKQLVLLAIFACTIYGQESGNKHLLEAKQISIIVADDANIKAIDGEKKAVFLVGQTYDYVGLLIKIEGTSNNPLVKIRKKTDLVGSYRLQKYSENEYFYYGDPGEYLIEYIDLIDNIWVNEFLETNITSDSNDDVEPGDREDDNTEPNDPEDNLTNIKEETYRQMLLIADKQLLKKLLNEYIKAYEMSIGKSNDELRRLMVESRRNLLLSEDEVNVRIDLIDIDTMITEAGEDKYRLAIEHFISGMKKALEN